MDSPKMKVWILISTVGLALSQLSPLRQLQMNMLQRRNNLLQQSMLQNLRNPATSIGTGPSLDQSTRLINQLNTMTQNMMNNLNARTPVAAPSVDANNFVPVDVLLRQQRNLQAQMLQNLQNIQNTNLNGLSTQNVDLTQSSNTQSPQQPTTANDVTVVVVRNETASQNVPETTVSQTSEVNPFAASTGNVTFDDIFTNFGGFSFPSTSADFWTGRTDTTGASTENIRQLTDSPSSVFPSSVFPSTGGFTNSNPSSQQTTGSRTTFDPATGITFGSGFTPSQQSSSGIDALGTGTTFWSGGTSGTNFQTVQGSTGNTGSGSLTETNFGASTQNVRPTVFGIGLPGGFTESQQTTFETGTSGTGAGTSGAGIFGASTSFGTGTSDTGTGAGTSGTGIFGASTSFGTGTSDTGTGAGTSGTGIFGASTSFGTGTSDTGTGAGTSGTGIFGAGTSGAGTTFDAGLTTGELSTAIASEALSCTEEYQKIPGHTLCMTDSPYLTKAGVNIDDRLRITQIHNSLRANVQPPATDLVTLQWDDRIAAVAQKWAKQCRLAHDTERKIPEMGMSFGQNVAVGFETWAEAIQMWYDEVSLYRYGLEPDSYLGRDGWRQVAHFTQIVQNATYLIGCGYAECPDTQYMRYYVCNYAAGQTDLAYPYTAGLRCERCPNSCINGLCDCGGLVCYNGGTLDPNTCKCECPRPYTGDRCDIVDCPVSDNWICGRDWPPSYCDRFYNVPEECPYMCGICGDGSTGTTITTTTPNVTTFTSAFGCRYTGIRDDAASCRNYGEKGSDMRMCASEGGTVGCGDCDRYFNIKRDYCPVMCGLCDPPCAGKRCNNGGTLDTNSCSCRCRKPFTGDICEFAQCPINGDPGFCQFWPPRYCQMYYNVPEECPYMCGICKMDNPTVSVRGKSLSPGELENPTINTRGRPKRLGGDVTETRRKR